MLCVTLPYGQSGRAKSHKIGVLHSLSGTMALSETLLVDAVRLEDTKAW